MLTPNKSPETISSITSGTTSDTSLSITVVGHTNTGKTSFLRSLLRNENFGAVENRAGTTRHVEEINIKLPKNKACCFFDTPGMEDAMAVLDGLDELLPSLRNDSLQTLKAFITEQSGSELFEQEMKVLRQVLNTDVCIYVIDARQSVLGKYRDELQLLAFCGKPILPLLNFTQQVNKVDEWKAVLASLNLHVIANFDTVMFNQDHEMQLFEQIKLLVSDKKEIVEALVDFKTKQWNERTYLAKKMIATSLIDLAAWQEKYTDDDDMTSNINEFQEIARVEERNIVEKLLNIYEFPQDVLEYTQLELVDNAWKQDLFDADTWALYGLDVGSAVAKGGAVGFTLDLLTGGMSLGLGTVLGASAGLFIRKGREWTEKVQGYKIWRLNAACLQLIYARQQLLLKILSSRRHANLSVDRLENYDFETHKLVSPLKKARFKSHWSHLNNNFKEASVSRSIEIDNLLKEL